ncbi:ABC transporter permease [Dyella subtropica]|uniref:ABC transporter permease n=1 Tax=Dyella subtropica TaxID=2992127 RepID=UPI00225A3129|nr:ABC transporter permease [Dyella subtropica]
MFSYYLQLGLRSLRRNPLLTALMVMAIGFGVAASMITYSVFRAVSGNPIPEKSERLFTPQIDSWGPKYNLPGNEPPYALNYVDAMALMRDHKAKRQTMLYPIGLSALPRDAQSVPFNVQGFTAQSDFFAMFDVPFQYGSAWAAADDEQRAAVVVISRKLNDKLFDGANSLGREITLSGHNYRVVGVTENWNPKPRFFTVWSGSSFGEPSDIYIPLSRALDLRIDTAGSNSCRGRIDYQDWDGWLQSNCVWVTPWVQLDSAAEIEQYRQFLEGYAADQQRAGRYGWAPNVRLRNVMQWLDYMQVVPQESSVSLLVALCFFAICLINTIGLLLAKFLRRASEIGVRRALGASRREIYVQYLIEAGAVGLAGGVLGLLLTALGISGIGLLFQPQIARLAHLDLALVGLTLLVSVLATMVAALYPTWRAAQVQPAWQLKSN